MTWKDFLASIDTYRGVIPDDAEVHVLTQPHYPLQSPLRGVVARCELPAYSEDLDAFDRSGTHNDVLLVARDEATPAYHARDAWEVAR